MIFVYVALLFPSNELISKLRQILFPSRDLQLLAGVTKRMSCYLISVVYRVADTQILTHVLKTVIAN